MSGKNQDFILEFQNISVKCCKCYVDYWKSLRQLKGIRKIDHDSSIEKVKTYRKYYPEDKELLHFCIDCFKRVMFTIPMSVIIFEMRFHSRACCVGYFLLGEKMCDEICDTCVNFVIKIFNSDFITV